MSRAFGQAFKTLSNQPGMLWGLSLLSTIVTLIAVSVCALVPAAGVAVAYVLSCGLAKVYLDALADKKINSDQLFEGFDRTFLRRAGGMAWKDFWIFVWMLVPVIGPIIACVKGYSYAFVPYILMTKPDVKATEALRMSMRMTYGRKGGMFLADLLWGGGCSLVSGLITYLLMRPQMEETTKIIIAVIGLIVTVFLTLFSGIIVGLYKAAFYVRAEEEENGTAGDSWNGAGYGGYSAEAYNPAGYAVQGGAYGQQAVSAGYGNAQMMSQPGNSAGNIYAAAQQYYQQNAAQGYVCRNCGARHNAPTAVCMNCGSRMQ